MDDDLKADFDRLTLRQEELLAKEKTEQGLTDDETYELREVIVKRSSLQEQMMFPH